MPLTPMVGGEMEIEREGGKGRKRGRGRERQREEGGRGRERAAMLYISLNARLHHPPEESGRLTSF